MTTADRDGIATAVLDIVREETGDATAAEQSTFASLDVESLTFAEILMRIEDHCGASLGLEEEFALNGTATIEQLI